MMPEVQNFRIPFQRKNIWIGTIITTIFQGFLFAQHTGIGTTMPQARLHVQVPAGWSSPVFLVDTPGGVPYLILVPGGNLGIGVANPQQRLDVGGNIQFAGALMPGGQPGNPGDVLVSQGPGNPPQWTPAGNLGDNWGSQTAVTASPIIGNGLPGNPITLQPGNNPNEILVWDGNSWTLQQPGPGNGLAPICSGPLANRVIKWTGSQLCNSIITDNGNSVGINVALPQARLHVGGNLRIDSDFRPGGNPGTPGQVLVSQGPGNPPQWQNLSGVASKVLVFSSEATSIVCATSTASFTTIATSPWIPLQPGDTIVVLAWGQLSPSDVCSPPDNSFSSCGQACAFLRIEPDNWTGLTDLGGGFTVECVHFSTAFANHYDFGDNWQVVRVFRATSAVSRQFRIEAMYYNYADAGCYPKFWSNLYYGGTHLVVQVIR